MIGKTNANADAILFQHVESLEKVISADLPLSGWIMNSDGLYYQEILIDDITAQDMAQLLKYTSPSISEDDYAKYSTDFALITGGQAGNGKIAFYAKDILSQDITVFLGMGKKGDGRLLIGGSSASEKQQIANVVITITDNAAIAEGGSVTAACNGKSWSSTIKNGKAKLYASSVGNYTITVNTTDGATYTTMLICPYFGQFSTDIYSGTLVVTCTEDGGNGKTCNVQSCDASYNPTDAYNLSQTFDSSLKLTFLGIPAGKYLVTVDDKYVFFKEIESIQNINSVKVECKQWLYNNGDQCTWNTGGWMKCAVNYRVANVGYDNGFTSGTASASVDFLENRIKYICTGSANSIMPSGYKRFFRAGIYVSSTFGTQKPIINISSYRKMIVDNANNLIGTFRVGNESTSSTDINTPTVLQSAAANNMDLAMEQSNPYLVLGNKYSYPEQAASGSGDHIAFNDNAEITEIYLA